MCNLYCSNVFYLYILYTAFVYIFVFFSMFVLLHSIFQSLDAYFGFKQWTTPMDSEFALQIGSLFPWRAQQTQILHSLLQCPPLPHSTFINTYIYIFNIIKNKLLRIQKKCIVYLKNISFSLFHFSSCFLLIRWFPINSFGTAAIFPPVSSSFHRTAPLTGSDGE